MDRLAHQLHDLIAGLESEHPGLRRSLAEALGSSSPTTNKMTKSEADYRRANDGGQGNDGNDNSVERCDTCSNFQRDGHNGSGGRCSVVAGAIDPEFVCDHYVDEAGVSDVGVLGEDSGGRGGDGSTYPA